MNIIINPYDKVSEKEMRFWLAENVGQCHKGIYGFCAEGRGWKYEISDEISEYVHVPRVLWKITIDDNDLATAFSMRFL